MKVKCFLLIFILNWYGPEIPASAQQSLNLAGYDLPSHPRILLQAGEEAGIWSTIKKDTVWNTMHQAILNESDRMLTEDLPERKVEGRRLLGVSREALRRIFYLSYAWRMSGEEKYFQRAEEELLAVSAFSDWNPSHFLDVAEMTMGVAIGYDWLFDALSDRSKAIIKEAILKKGIEPSLGASGYNDWLQETHNWNQVGNAGMTFGALAIYEDEPEIAEKVIERAIKNVVLPMKEYGPDGAYPEGYMYWGYGTTFNVMLISALENVYGHDFGLSDQPGFLKTAEYLLHMTGPTGEAFNYSDSGTKGSLKPAMFWFAEKTNKPSLLWTEKKWLKETDPSKPTGNRLLPAIMIWSQGINMNEIPPPEDKMWAGGGKVPVALMRTSWTDPEAIYVGIKGGSPSVNHGHMDAGSFIMDASGTRWAMDFGLQKYNTLETAGVDLWNREQDSERWQVFRYTTQAHNTLTVNDKPQITVEYAPLISWSDKPSFMNAVVDMSDLYKDDLKKAVRGIAIIDNKYVEVRDQTETTAKEAKIRWTLLTAAKVKITGKNTALLSRDGEKLLLKVVSPGNIQLKTWSTDPPNEYDAENPGTILTGFETTVKAGKKGILVVQLIPQPETVSAGKAAPPLKGWPKEKH